MLEQIQLAIGDRTENHARIMLRTPMDSLVAEIIGVVRGPYCEFSKTLTADFPLQPVTNSGSVAALVIEPCYWTPQLPFWYDLRLQLHMKDGSEREQLVPLCLRRWSCMGRSFRLDSKRIVLRGLRFPSPTESDLLRARQWETALVVELPSEETCREASRWGVPLVADLRNCQRPCEEIIPMYDFHPAVMLVLMSVQQLSHNSLAQSLTAACVTSTSEKPNVNPDLFVVELDEKERPPTWLSKCDKPVVAIRKGPINEIATARAACDFLQAELAPEFDLAGYFV